MTTKFAAQFAVVESVKMPQLETIKGRIRARLDATGLSANEASRRANLGLSYVNDLLAGKSKNPVTTRLAQLATVLGCDLEYLLGSQDMPVKGDVVSFPTGAPLDDEPFARALPLFSVSLTDPDGFFVMVDAETGRFSASVNADANAYAVSVADDLMSPRFLPGETVIVNTRKPVAPGACVVVRLNDDRALIRRVVAISATEIELGALKTAETIKVARADLKAIHRVVACCES